MLTTGLSDIQSTARHIVRPPSAIRTVCIAALALLFACFAPAPAMAQAEPNDKPLLFLAEAGSPPLSYYENGEPKGVYVDIVRALSKAMGREIRLELMDWNIAQERVAHGDADGLIFIAPSDKRKELFDFTDPIWTDDYGVFVRSGDMRIHGAHDLAGKKVGVTHGGYPAQFFQARGSDIQLVYFQNYQEGFNLLRAGSIDAIATHTWLATYAIQQRGWHDVTLAERVFVSVPAGVAVKKGNAELVAQINTALHSVVSAGTITRIQNRWRPQEMLFFSRQQVEHTVFFSVMAVTLVILGSMGAWVVTLKKQIQSRKTAELALRQSEEKFAKSFEASPDCMAIAEWGSGRILDVNHSFEAITGYAREDILGRTPWDLHLFDDLTLRETIVQQLRASGHVRDLEYRLRRKSCEMARMVLSAELLEIGGRRCILSVHRDVTAQKEAELALHNTEARFRSLVENANDIIFTVDPNGMCLSMNRMGEQITGYRPENPRGMSFQDLVVPHQSEIAWTKLKRVLAGEEVRPFDIEIVSKSGKQITLELNVRPIYENGVAVGAQGIARDITVRRELEAQLRQAQKMEAVGQLAAGVAHDFNNLLTVIMGNCEASVELLPEGDGLQEAFRDIQTAAQRAASLTSQLLAFSRRQVIQPRPLNLNDVIAETQRMLRRVIGEDIALEFIPAGSLSLVNADEGQIHQIVMNLAVNARDAMPHGGRLTLETKDVRVDEEYAAAYPQMGMGDYVLLSISDNGVGMDEATLARIFEPFFTTKEVGRGTGLGLATVYGIVKQNGGFIWVHSSPGLGARFMLYFPRLEADRAQQVAAVPHVHAATARETLMLVEDEKPLRDLMVKHLKHAGYDVLSAQDGKESLAISAALAQAPDLMITDVVMPGMSGPALADSLRTTFPQLKVLYLSGYSDEALLRRGVLPNGTYFLQKPFLPSVLSNKVREILDQG